MLESYNLEGVLICTLFFVVILLYAVFNKNNTKGRNIFYPHILILIFCVFAFWSQDYYGYIESLKLIDFRFPNAEQRTHLEPLYVWIGSFVDGNYTLFRLCIWGVSYILFLKTLQNLDIKSRQAIALFIVYFLLIFSYARVSLGMASLFYGVSLLINNGKWRVLKMCIGLAMLLLAYNAHKSMFIAIVLLPFIFLRLNKYSILIIAATFISAAMLIGGDVISDLLFTTSVNDEYGEFIQESASSYFTIDANEQGIASQLIYLTQIISLVLPIAYCYANDNASKYVSSNFTLRCYVNYSTLLVLIGVALGLVTSFSSPISYRILNMTYIPNIIVICTLYKRKVLPQSTYDRFFHILTLYPILKLLYAIYCLIV